MVWRIMLVYVAICVAIIVPCLIWGTTVTVETMLKRTGNGVEAIAVPLEKRPLSSKINPVWWFGNDDEADKNQSWSYRHLRNIMQNFRWYVVGIADRPHKVTGLYMSPWGGIAAKRSDMRPVQSGVQLSVCWIFGLPLLPWVSLSYRYLTTYAGWEPSGGLGFMLVFGNSDIRDAEAINAGLSTD